MFSFPVILINSLSVLMLCIVIVVAWRKRFDTCARQLIVTSVFMLIWAVGSFMEMAYGGLQEKILWRNIEQIGVFGTPAAILMFSITYTAYFKKYIRLLSAVIYSIQAVSVSLIFTDRWHHWLRRSVYIASGNRYETLIVQTTTFAKLLISINFICMAASLLLLIGFLISTEAKEMKKPAICLIAGIGVSVAYSLVKVASDGMFGIMVPISGVFALSDLSMLYGIFRYDLLRLAPLARNEVFNIIGDGIIIATEKGKIVDFNRAAREIFSAGGNGNESSPDALSIEKTIANSFPDWHTAITRDRSGRLNFQTENGKVLKYYACELYPVYSKQTSIGSISVIKDVTEQKKYTDLLKQRAEKDGLTGTYNRKTFIERVDKILNEYDSDVCLLFMDVDYFKDTNDKYGHDFGDYILIETCGLILSQLPGHAFMGRMGGEEFAVFLKAAGDGHIRDYAEELRRIIAGHEFVYNGAAVHSTVSIGIAVGRFESFDELYHTADVNLYKAKEAGRNRVFGGEQGMFPRAGD